MISVSIIVPIYNAENYIIKTVESIKKQTYKNIQIILVNDGSTDCTDVICQKLAQDDTRINYVYQKNQGVSTARNLGLKMAKGEYVCFVDADDIMREDMVEKLLLTAIKKDKDICMCNYVEIKNNADYERKITQKDVMTRDEALRGLCIKQDINMAIWNKIFSRKCISNIFFEEKRKVNEDRFFLFQSLLKSNGVAIVAEPLYSYVVRENSATTSSFDPRWFDRLYFAKKIENEIMNYDKTLKEEAQYCVFDEAIAVMVQLIEEHKVKEYYKEYCDALSIVKKTDKQLVKKFGTLGMNLQITICKISPNFFYLIRRIKEFMH